MAEGITFSVDEEFSQVVSDAEDWDGGEGGGGISHYLPTLEEMDSCDSKPRTNMFLRTRAMDTSRRPLSQKSTSRNFFTVSKPPNEAQDVVGSQELQNVCSWQVDLTSRVRSNGSVAGEKRMGVSSFMDRCFKIPTNVRRPEAGVELKTRDQLGNRGPTAKQSSVRINSREDGTTIITASHHQRDEQQSKRVKGNKGWGNNFVRLNLKNGNMFGRVKGARKFSRKKSKWKTEPLRQVGDGSNYLSGWEQRNAFTCYNCGQPGHFASSCDSILQGTYHTVKDGDSAGAPMEPAQVSVKPLYTWTTLDDLVVLLESKFGHSNFRGSQLEVVTRIREGKSCLNIMPTGMGKSLCYQLPAFFVSGPVVVISPLIALMQDQCDAAPKELNPSILWSGQTPKEALQVLDDLKRGKTRLVFISPERATNEHFLEAIKPWLPLELLVIDEAHCISEWGHSFRPSYYRLGKVVRTELPSKSILALTATATPETEQCIRHVLGISQNDVFRLAELRENMDLRVENIDHCYSNFEKWRQIASKLRPILELSSRAILYCSFRKDADNLAKALAMSSFRAKSYHSGISSADRNRILSSFATGTIKVVVATTAFGMGINISAVDTVIHISMPRSLEEYVQQVGRAGRNGESARCFCYLNKSDFLTLRSLCSNPHIRRESISRIIDAIFGDLKIGYYGNLDLRKLADGQIPEETVESILCFLENRDSGLLTYFGSAPQKARISFYSKSPEDMEEPIVTSILKVCPRSRQGVYHVSIADLCSETGKTPAKNFQELAAMSQRSSIGFEPSKEKGSCYRVDQTITRSERLKLIDDVTAWMEEMNTMMIYKLDVAHKAFQAAALVESEQGILIRSIIKQYFSSSSEEFSKFLDDIISAHGLESKVNAVVKRGGQETVVAAKAVLRRAKEHGVDISASEISNVLHGRLNTNDKKKGLDQMMSVFWGRLRDTDHRDVLSAAEAAIKEHTD